MNSSLKTNFEKGEDKFKGLYNNIDAQIQINYGHEIGLGNKEYELINV
jgi:uncharacterized protein